MELELKHLAPYLPYGLKVNRNGTDWSYELESCNKDGVITDTSFQHYWEYEVIKPILRPLSSLYTEMEDGKVPIVEIYKKMFVFPRIKEYKIEDGCLKFDKHTFEWVDEFRAFSLDGDTAYITIEVSDYLDSLHFDWRYGLIDKGLALDKTKIK